MKPIDLNLIAVAEGDYVTVPVERDEDVNELTPAQREQSPNSKSACEKPPASSNSRKRRKFATRSRIFASGPSRE